AYHAILLDIDNGPDAVMFSANSSLYSSPGLTRLRRALAPRGVLAIWSADRSARFEKRLEAAGFSWRAAEISARGAVNDVTHTIYFASAV
ncbi:MAG: hypothetical protein C3F11_21810, partial [Methylocystaceae bacterium]